MTKFMPTIAAALLAGTAMIATSATAQTNTAPTTTSPPATTAPSEKATPPAASTTTPPAAASTSKPSMTDSASLTLTDAEAKDWVDKRIYSSDNQNLGEVAAFARDSSGKVTEMHADIGGFLGLGETRVRLMPSQFKLQNDRVVVNMTAEQAKALPQIAK